MTGSARQDPHDPDAVVVSQAPPPATLVGPGEIVGFRTALIDAELCAVLTELPPRQGDAVAVAACEPAVSPPSGRRRRRADGRA